MTFEHCLAIARSAADRRYHFPGTIIKNHPFRPRPEQGQTPRPGRVKDAVRTAGRIRIPT